MNKKLKLAVAWSILLTTVGLFCYAAPIVTVALLITVLLMCLLVWALNTITKS